MNYKVLTIAGSDCSGGAGIQADIKTITVHKMYAMSVITALTAQNTLGVYDIMEVTPKMVEEQLDCIFKDITPDAVKIGMVSNPEIIKVIAKKLKEYKAKNIVVDPVMVSTSGCSLSCDSAVSVLVNELFPLATVITPNLTEAAVLSKLEIRTKEDMIKAAKVIGESLQGGVLIKGGHLSNTASDLLLNNNTMRWYESERIDNDNTHGTGCTLSSAIACQLAKSLPLEESIRYAKEYITGALKAKMNLGHGSGPLNHAYNIE